MKKAFILIPVLFLTCSLSLLIQTYSYIRSTDLIVFRSRKEIEKRQEIEQIVIQRIKEEFYEYKEENFEMNIGLTHIKVTYKDLLARIEATGEITFKATLKYNDEYGTVLYYRYRTNSSDPAVWEEDSEDISFY